MEAKELKFQKWIEALNSGGDMSCYFCAHSVLLYKNEPPIMGAHNIAHIYNLLSKIHGKVIKRNTIEQNHIVQTKEVIFELGEYIFEDDVTYTYLLGWRYINDQWYREIEAICKKTKHAIDFFGLDEARIRWETIASKQGAEVLVNSMYTENCHYFNRGTLYSGRELLSKVYQYMNDDQYSVALSAIVTHPVTDKYVFELGKWSTNGFSDLYMAIWEKTRHEEWRMRFDSNW